MPHESGRRFGIRDGLFQAIAQGGGEQYLSAFALLLHATPFQLSILSAIPQLLGTWAQLVSVKVAHWFPSLASQVFWGIIGQSLAWVPILALPLLWPDQGPWLLIAAVAVYFTFTHFTSPAWNSLITDLLEPNERGTYFARRSRTIAMTSFLALCLTGALLSFFEQQQLLWVGFAVMFLTAGLCRSTAALLLLKVRGLPSHEPSGNPTGFLVFLRTGTSKNFRHFLLFSGLMHSAVLVAGPFFVIYLLQDLHLAHWQYGTWLAAGIIGQFLTLPAWGQFGDRFGNKALLTFTGLLVAFLPMLYLFGTAWPFLVTVNFFGGVVWAGLGLGLNNYVFDVVQPTDRGKAVAISSIVNGIGWAMGTVIGSVLIDTLPDRLQAWNLMLEPVSNLPFIFFLSGLLRLIVSATLLRTFHEPRQVEQRAHHRLLWELPLLKPLRQLSRRAINLN
ncbi:MAG: MFS transporter [Nitrospira sp.]|nr:MFS transporter [Nitrospira sp.]MDH4343819.1 MFS transporter [Nitrospira sp.]MDH5337269.1 MFS transporter [Nitrospira sp.]